MNNRVIGKNNNIPNYNEISFLFYNISNVLYSLLILIATIPKKKKMIIAIQQTCPSIILITIKLKIKKTKKISCIILREFSNNNNNNN